ncbi:MAG: SDR family NAD(P)-dependent oxidoreductase, partial [Burkholderiales bacterium]
MPRSPSRPSPHQIPGTRNCAPYWCWQGLSAAGSFRPASGGCRQPGRAAARGLGLRTLEIVELANSLSGTLTCWNESVRIRGTLRRLPAGARVCRGAGRLTPVFGRAGQCFKRACGLSVRSRVTTAGKVEADPIIGTIIFPGGRSRESVLITGGGRGIGRATALRCAREGWSLTLNYRFNQATAEETASSIRAESASVVLARGDVTARADVLAMFHAACAAFSGLDGFVISAGVAAPSMQGAAPGFRHARCAMAALANFDCADRAGEERTDLVSDERVIQDDIRCLDRAEGAKSREIGSAGT